MESAAVSARSHLRSIAIFLLVAGVGISDARAQAASPLAQGAADKFAHLSSPPAGAAGSSEPAAPLKVIPDSFSDAVGTWDLSLDGSNRRCTLVLSAENSRNGRIVRFPAGCRRALPALGQVAGWLFADGGIRLVDANIRPQLKFTARADKSSLIGKGETSGTYSLVPLQTVAMLPPVPEAVAANESTPGAISDVPGARAIAGSQPVLPSDTLALASPSTAPAAPKPKDPFPIPGVYALDRFSAKDVCRIELAPSKVVATARTEVLSAAHILPGCRDGGITVFDPVSWRFANGHMTLKAKRGHALNLVASSDGTWRRDPDNGTTLVLRKIE